MATWSQMAVEAINVALKVLPENATSDEKKKAIDAAYPFGPRQYHPYKIWLKRRKEALAQIGLGNKDAGKKSPYYGLSPLEIAKMKSMR